MKRALTGIAAASVVLGMAVPTAFAANYSHATWHQETIKVGSSSIGFKGFDAVYAGTQTNYMPIYYLIEMLQKDGYQASWNGVNKVFSITTPSGVNVDMSQFSNPGQGTASIYLNGTLVQMTDSVVMKDPASHVNTTYMPVYFLLKVLQAIGAASQSDWNGNAETLNLVAPSRTTVTGTDSLSPIAVTGQTVGNGSDQSPAVASVNNAVTFSTTVTDANGNPVSAGTIVQFLVSTTNNLTVTDGSGNVLNSATLSAPIVIGNKTYDAYYSAPVGANGVASLEVTSNASTTNEPLYVVAQLPAESNGQYIRSNAATAEWGLPGTLVLAPLWGNQSNPDQLNFSTSSNPTQGMIPVVATLLPESGSSSSVAGKQVKFTVSASTTTSGVTPSVFITDSNGVNVLDNGIVTAGNNSYGSSVVYTATTNSNGQAIMYLNSNVPTQNNVPVNGAQVMAQVSAELVNGGSAEGDSYFQWQAQSQPAQIANISPADVLNSNSLSDKNREVAVSGSKLTISGQVQDAAGNPVPNVPLIVTDAPITSTIGADGTDSYVMDGQTYTFSNSSFDMITSDANGNFSFTVSDTVNPQEAHVKDTYYIYYAPATAGVVEGQQLPTNGLTLLTVAGSGNNGGLEVSWEPGTSVAAMGIQGGPLNSSYASLSDVPQGGTINGAVAQSNVGVHFGPYTQNGQEILPAQFPEDTLTYQLTVPQGYTMNQAFGGLQIDSSGPNSIVLQALKNTTSNLYNTLSQLPFDVTGLNVQVNYATSTMYLQSVQGYYYSNNTSSATVTPFSYDFTNGGSNQGYEIMNPNSNSQPWFSTDYQAAVNTSNWAYSSSNINGGTATLNVNVQVSDGQLQSGDQAQGGAAGSENIQFSSDSGVASLGLTVNQTGLQEYQPLIDTNSGLPSSMSIQGSAWDPTGQFLRPQTEMSFVVAPFNNYVNLAEIPQSGLDYTISSDGKADDSINDIDGMQISGSDGNFSTNVVVSQDGKVTANGQTVFDPNKYGLTSILGYSSDGSGYVIGENSSGDIVVTNGTNTVTGPALSSFLSTGSVSNPTMLTGDPMLVGASVKGSSIYLTYISGNQQEVTFSATATSSSNSNSVTENFTPIQAVTVGAWGRYSGTYTYTVTEGSQKATVTAEVTSPSGSVSSALFTPRNIVGTPDQPTNVTMTVMDEDGNPLPNADVSIIPTESPLQNVWITAVNGVALSSSVPMGSNSTSESEPTPVPLWNIGSGVIDYSSVNLPGAITATGLGSSSPVLTLTTNSQGQISLTLQDGGVTYAGLSSASGGYGVLQTSTYGQVYGASTSTPANLFVYSSNSSTSTNVVGQLPVQW
ncbi:beta strand repeat-containing protein [Alicyclobacillus tolerans]|uniref:Big-1 domain-containing protein n=1 Tax=Alicyclobacillus tolerans TaxID=90970 RepID=A0A1M6TF87_9BACL|nr:hypothetical protein [Alicyclobacillus montanus]SHK55633.1 hypothetical protein SAMN05443507_11659 [Alicyclobacillus montanus]